MAWIYKIVSNRTKDPIEFVKIEDSYRYIGDDPEKYLSFCFKKFFNDPHIQKLVQRNNWIEVFKCWCEDWDNLHYYRDKPFYGNKPGYQATTLADFLAMSGIKFWEYFPTDVQNRDEFAQKYCNNKIFKGLYWENN